MEQVDSGNVYSDLSSGAGWPSNEFDSSYDINSKAFSQHCGGNAEADINDPDADCDASDFDSDFDDDTDQPGKCSFPYFYFQTRHFSSLDKIYTHVQLNTVTVNSGIVNNRIQ